MGVALRQDSGRGSLGKKLRPGLDPMGVRGPRRMFKKPRKARPRVQGRAQGWDRGVEVLRGEGKRKLWGVLGVMPQKEVSGEAGAFRAVDEEEVPKELMFYPESSVPQGFYRELKTEYTQNKIL